MAVRITGYDGVGVIGGNKILIEDEERGTRLFLDFGQSFTQRAKFFEEYLKPRPGVGLRDPLRLNLLPPLEGIYRSDFAAALSDEDYSYLRNHPLYRDLRGKTIDAVYLSHAHLDHSGYISFLREDIPIYCTAMTAAICKVVQDVGQSGDFEREVCYFSWRKANHDGVLAPIKGMNYLGRPFVMVDRPDFLQSEFWKSPPAAGRKIELHIPQLINGNIGGLPFRFHAVDHSIFGATLSAFATSAGWIIYTGDLRFHGRRGPGLEEVASWARNLEPVALLCEGTRIEVQSTGRSLTEADVQEKAQDLAQNASGLILADFAARNVDRLLGFRDIAKNLGRQLAISPVDAYLLEAMRQVDPTLPDVAGEEAVVIYGDVKSRPRFWEQGIRKKFAAKMVHAQEVRHNPRRYILAFSFFDINDLVDIGLDQELSDALYLYSSSEAFNEELQIDIQRLQNWLHYFKISFAGFDPEKEPRLHVSGHAPGNDLLQLVRLVKPKLLIPIHTTSPDLFRVLEDDGIRVVLPEVGKSILL